MTAQEIQFLLFAGVIILPIFIVIVRFFFWIISKMIAFVKTKIPISPSKKSKKKTAQSTKEAPQIITTMQKVFSFRRIVFLSLFVSVATAIYVFSAYFMDRPYVIKTFPESHGVYADLESPVSVQFDKPIDPSTFEIRGVFDYPLAIEYVPVLKETEVFLSRIVGRDISIPFYREVKVTPKRSIPYDNTVVFYIVGLQNISRLGGQHEHSYEVVSPATPKFVSGSIGEENAEISQNASILLDFDSAVFDSLGLELKITPEEQYELRKTAPSQFEIVFTNKLKPGTAYKIEVFHKTQVFDYDSNEVIESQDPESIREFQFKTLNPPGIKEITPSGNKVSYQSMIKVTFNEPVDPAGVLEHLKIEPELEFDTKWDESSQILEILPKNGLAKATQYKIVIAKGTKTLKGGESIEDIVHTFDTLGAVKVSGFSPASGSKSVSVTSNMRIEFDQRVDWGNAPTHVSISPAIATKHSWSGSTLTFDPQGNLNYQTKYTVTISPGVQSVDGLDSTETFTYSFTTQPETVTLSVPRYTQGGGTFDCNVVAARMALSYRGISVSNDQVKAGIGYGAPFDGGTQTGGNPNSLWIDHYGTHWDPLANYIRNYRGADVKRNWNIAGIASEIRNGNPVIIWWYNGVSNTNVDMTWYNQYGAKPGMHSVVVYGYKGPEGSPTHLLVKDPWFTTETYTASSFNSKWGYFSRSAVVVK